MGGEAAGVPEAVEGGAACGVAPQKHPVAALIEKETGLLPAADVDAQVHLAFPDLYQPRRLLAAEVAGAAVLQAVRPPRADVAALVDPPGFDHLLEDVEDLGAQQLHPPGVELHHEVAGVVVDDEAGQAVVLPVDETDRVGGGGQLRVAAADQDRPADRPCQETAVDAAIAVPGQHADGDGRVGIVVAAGDEPRSEVAHVDDFSGGDMWGRRHGAAVHPGMPPDQQAFAVAAELEFRIAHGKGARVSLEPGDRGKRDGPDGELRWRGGRRRLVPARAS